ncbi:uncharacterized protein [Nicotiana sylvestris]|uniref:uncharacterized protein n=1 Tax=Nicotiana sylvestris TaxID=4096 RepID=UPI00388CDF9E
MEARVRRFVQGTRPLVINEVAIAALNSDMNYGKMVAFTQAIENRKLKNKMEREGSIKAQSAGNLDGSSGGGGKSTFRGGLRGHIQTNCRSSRQGKGRGITHPSSSAAAISTTPPPAQGTPVPARRGATRGSTRSLGGPNRFYAVRGHQSSEASLDIVTGILIIQSHDVYALIDPSSSLSYVTPYVAMEFGIESEQLHESFFVSIPVGGSIVAVQVYRDCVVTVCDRDTIDDLIKLGMVDFDVIIGMDWLYSCFAKLDCRTRTVRFEFPSESVIEWKGIMCYRTVVYFLP